MWVRIIFIFMNMNWIVRINMGKGRNKRRNDGSKPRGFYDKQPKVRKTKHFATAYGIEFHEVIDEKKKIESTNNELLERLDAVVKAKED